jgi:hypothetical protein
MFVKKNYGEDYALIRVIDFLYDRPKTKAVAYATLIFSANKPYDQWVLVDIKFDKL